MTDTESSAPGPEDRSTELLAGAPEQAAEKKSPGQAVGLYLLAVLVLLALAFSAYQYWLGEQNQAKLQQQLAENIRQLEQARSQADQALVAAKAQSSRVQSLEKSLAATSGQLHELNQALQLLTDTGSDILLLNDIEQLLMVARQQLDLGGNVANAIVAMESAQARLARANRPALAALQQSINGDLDRMRAVVTINLPALSERTDELFKLLNSAVLLVPEDAHKSLTETDGVPDSGLGADLGLPAIDQASWQNSLNNAWRWLADASAVLAQDLRGLFDIRRVDDAAALLMSPDQALRFREALQQRTMTAQLALMMHQARIWRTELAHIAQALEQRFDMRDQAARNALRLARDLHDTPIEIALPDIENSLAAIAAAREAASPESAQTSTAAEPAAAEETAPESGAAQDSQSS